MAQTGTGGAAPLLPRYGRQALSDVLPSAAAVLGVPGFENVLDLPAADRICVLLLDGLGWNLLRRHARHAPFLAELATDAAPITVGFPATTATSLASLGTGLPPGRHGLLGYQVAVAPGQLMNLLRWDAGVDPVEWQPRPTVFERVALHGTEVSHVGPGAFRESGLTRAALRGARYVGAETDGDLVAAAAAAAGRGRQSLVFAYHSEVDKTGHLRGCRSPAWRYQLAVADRMVEQLVGALPHDTVLVVVGDHGMVDVPADRRLDADTHPDLRRGVALLAGEARARHVHAVTGAAVDVLATWREVLGADAWVVGREEAVAAGWFGPQVTTALADRIGDVVAAATGDAAVVASRAEPFESMLVGMHGSLTPDELLVPLLVTTGRADPVAG